MEALGNGPASHVMYGGNIQDSKMKRNSSRIPSGGAIRSQRRPKATVIIITTLSWIITPGLTMPTSISSDPDQPPHKPCKSDYECPDKFYCYTRRSPQQYCVPCHPCSRLNRAAAANGCAKSRDECGPCLPGYHNLTTICSGVPDDFGRENHESNIKTEAAESTETGSSSWILFIVGAGIIIAIVVVLIVAILIFRKRPRWRRGPRMRRVEKDIELNEQNAHNSSLPSAPPPPYEEPEHHNQSLAHGATLVKESSQQRNPLSLPPELLNSQDIIIVDNDDDDAPLNDLQDALLDAIEQEFLPQPEEEPEYAQDAVPNGDNFGDGWEDQELSLHEESMHLEDPIDLNHEAAAAVPPEDIQPLPVDRNHSPPFELMLDIRFEMGINWLEYGINIEEEMPLHRSGNDSGVDDTSVADDSMDHIVPNLDSHIENLDTGSVPHAAGSVPHAGGRLETVYEGPMSLALERLGYANNDEGFSTDETEDEGRPLNLNEVVGHDLEHANDDLMEVSLELD